MMFMRRRRQRSALREAAVTTRVPQSYRVRVPENARPGEAFQVIVGDGRAVRLVCPQGTSPGDYLMFRTPDNDYPAGQEETDQPPIPPGREVTTARQIRNSNQEKQPKAPKNHRVYEVTVPSYATPGTPFALAAGGTRVLVTCPRDARPGQKIRFTLPIVMLRYGTEQWTRTVRVSDSKFQWIRVDAKGDVEATHARFDIEKSAYVRSLKFSQDRRDPRFRAGILTLVRADEAAVDSTIKNLAGETIAMHSDIATIQSKSFKEKCKWFRDTCSKLSVRWADGHMRIAVRRSHLLADSFYSVMSLGRKDFKKIWRLEFIGEEAIDAGGVSREWFHLIFEEIFDPNRGLFKPSIANQACMIINSLSGYCCDDHLKFFRFAGRMLAKALFDRQIVNGHFAQLIYKHLLGWPIDLKDLQILDPDYYKSLRDLEDMVASGMDLSHLCLDFTVTKDIMGAHQIIELVPNGSNIMLTNENLSDYIDACLKHMLLHVFKPQLQELLLGFFDVIPEPLLTIFDFKELELLMCGLPSIDLSDWQKHTIYTGEYDQTGTENPTVGWFWEVVAEFNEAKKARLLQFITGTSGVPPGGFSMLQGSDGNIRKFTIQGVQQDHFPYPRAHTCFNRIDLPTYQTKEELRNKLDLVVTTTATGFGLE